MKFKSIKTMILGLAVMFFGGIWVLSVSGELSGLIGFPILLVGLIIVIVGFSQKD